MVLGPQVPEPKAGSQREEQEGEGRKIHRDPCQRAALVWIREGTLHLIQTENIWFICLLKQKKEEQEAQAH
jgi:hypothetical protein